jgi:hypothetical protein
VATLRRESAQTRLRVEDDGMPMSAAVWLSIALMTGQAPKTSEPDPARAADEAVLKDHKVPLDGAGPLDFFRTRTLSKEQVAKLKATLKLLGSLKHGERQQAATDLVRAGNLARPLLVEAVEKADDFEIARRAELCLKQMADGGETKLAGAAARQIGRTKPAQAAAVLLDYLPFAVDRRVIESVQGTLNQVAVRDGKPEPAVLEALRDAHAVKRGAAAEALVRAGGLNHKRSVEALLSDKAVPIRLQVTMALIESRDKEAVSNLIDLIPSLPADQVWQAEDLLARIAGDNSPGVYVGGKTPAPKVRDAWAGWYKKNEYAIDLAKLQEAPALAGYTMISQMETPVAGKGLGGRVYELKPNGEMNWSIDNLRYALDVQYLSKDRVLIAEYLGRRVTERDTKGEILWEKAVDLPIACQRLPNGHTFIATRRQLLVVDRNGKEVFTYFHQNTSITAATRLRDGQMVLFTSGGLCQRLDSTGQEVKTFTAGQVYTMGGNIEVLPGNRILAPLYRENRVVEYDFDGNQVWQAAVNYPTSATRLPNGNTLVVSMTRGQVVEIDREGKEVWSQATPGGRPYRARKR